MTGRLNWLTASLPMSAGKWKQEQQLALSAGPWPSSPHFPFSVFLRTSRLCIKGTLRLDEAEIEPRTQAHD
jgi:hypothetical protein